jgi:hypothetical protein
MASKFKAVCIAQFVAPIETCCGAVKYQLVAQVLIKPSI